MAVSETIDLTVNLMGREFKIACPVQEEASLRASVDYLNEKLDAMRDSGKIMGSERVALMTALQIAHESRIQSLAQAASPPAALDEGPVRRRLQAIQQQIGLAMGESPEAP